MELLPAECYEHRHTSAPIIHAPSPLTETHSLRAVCVCTSPQEQPHNSEPITLSVGELTQINNKRVCKHKYRVQIGVNEGNNWKR